MSFETGFFLEISERLFTCGKSQPAWHRYHFKANGLIFSPFIVQLNHSPPEPDMDITMQIFKEQSTFFVCICGLGLVIGLSAEVHKYRCQ